jgi:hypothetical protein
MTKIVTRRVWFDWVAHYQGDVEHCGWGHTKEAAITDLLRLDIERQEDDELLVLTPGPRFFELGGLLEKDIEPE